MQTCGCTLYNHLALTRESVKRRVGETRQIKQYLRLLARHPDGEHLLLKCRVCGRLWQSSRAWNLGDQEYVFKVPDIPEAEWQIEPYVQPDELAYYAATTGEHLEGAGLEVSAALCRVSGCRNDAAGELVVCLEHHLKDLHETGTLGSFPEGRWFPPYSLNG
jgi:hypothetical protein